MRTNQVPLNAVSLVVSLWNLTCCKRRSWPFGGPWGLGAALWDNDVGWGYATGTLETLTLSAAHTYAAYRWKFDPRGLKCLLSPVLINRNYLISLLRMCCFVYLTSGRILFTSWSCVYLAVVQISTATADHKLYTRLTDIQVNVLAATSQLHLLVNFMPCNLLLFSLLTSEWSVWFRSWSPRAYCILLPITRLNACLWSEVWQGILLRVLARVIQISLKKHIRQRLGSRISMQMCFVFVFLF